jgi:hypothetical protein
MRLITLIALALSLTACGVAPASSVIMGDAVDSDTPAEDTGIMAPSGPACDGINEGANFGREDIVFCDTDTFLQLADALDVCDESAGWHVCGDDEFIARNSLFSASDNGMYLGVLDSGHDDLSKDDCAMYHTSNEVGDRCHHGSVDSIAGSTDNGSMGGTCDNLLPTPHPDDFNYADTLAADPNLKFSGRQAGSLVADEPGLQFGVLCCS